MLVESPEMEGDTAGSNPLICWLSACRATDPLSPGSDDITGSGPHKRCPFFAGNDALDLLSILPPPRPEALFQERIDLVPVGRYGPRSSPCCRPEEQRSAQAKDQGDPYHE